MGLSEKMLGLLKKHVYPIGIDIEDDGLKLVQLGDNGKGTSLIASNRRNRPEDVKPGSSDWQRWAIETIHLLTTYGDFRGKEVVAAMPTSGVFIDHIRMPKTDNGKVEEAIFSKIKQKLPFESLPQNTMMQYIPTEMDNVLVMATERRIIDRHLAIYERAGLAIKSMGVWPVALTNCYTRFFGRRRSDLEAIVMLICIEANCTNVAICRHKNVLFARSVPIGVEQLGDEKAVTRLALELSGCRRHFSSIYREAQIERLIFLSGQSVDRQICATIAKQLEMPAQVADCLAAVDMAGSHCSGRDIEHDTGRSDVPIERRISTRSGIDLQKREQINWAIAFGLSLS